MDTLIRHLKFNLTFNQELLKIDLDKVMKIQWVNHYNTRDYDGKWTSIALMSSNGSATNIYALNTDEKEIQNTEVVEYCSYFKEILASLPFKKTAVRLLNLYAGAQIKPHTDHELGYEDGCFRIHIPIITNCNVNFILDNERLIMNEGECWYINANFTHSVANNGTTDRVHLVIDGIRNEWTDTLFFKHANKDNFVKPKRIISEDQKNRIIEELKLMNTKAANQLIDEMSKKE